MDGETKPPEGWGDALNEASASAMMWNQSCLHLARAKDAEEQAKARFIAAMARIDRLVRPQR